MRKLKFFILLFLFSPFLFGFTLTWENPTTNSNGTPVTDLATIRVYQSPISGAYSDPLAEIPADVPGATQSYTGTNPESGRLYWVVRACDTAGNCSGPSSEASFDFLDKTAPGAPGGLRVTE
jgi:hypothetical protein